MNQFKCRVFGWVGYNTGRYLNLAHSSPPWDWIARPVPNKLKFPAHPKPQLQHSWRYILSSACILAPIQTHNDWSRSPQPGATPSTLFTLLPLTHSSCSSPNDAGPRHRCSEAGREQFSLWLHFKPGPFKAEFQYFEIWCFYLFIPEASASWEF